MNRLSSPLHSRRQTQQAVPDDWGFLSTSESGGSGGNKTRDPAMLWGERGLGRWRQHQEEHGKWRQHQEQHHERPHQEEHLEERHEEEHPEKLDEPSEFTPAQQTLDPASSTRQWQFLLRLKSRGPGGSKTRDPATLWGERGLGRWRQHQEEHGKWRQHQEQHHERPHQEEHLEERHEEEHPEKLDEPSEFTPAQQTLDPASSTRQWQFLLRLKSRGPGGSKTRDPATLWGERGLGRYEDLGLIYSCSTSGRREGDRPLTYFTAI
ncbi:hypothetical protein NDU88_003910 [Pleurodeles waltl]|uniref:Uncharacterized protein n=1 Tax=Pleurodeles waltl TaxID=8319 RepID=A0AAV7NHW7_PLEWA|nr:hypothetical protein NDU88_003910 [Pleurodeles waltl]